MAGSSQNGDRSGRDGEPASGQTEGAGGEGTEGHSTGVIPNFCPCCGAIAEWDIGTEAKYACGTRIEFGPFCAVV